MMERTHILSLCGLVTGILASTIQPVMAATDLVQSFQAAQSYAAQLSAADNNRQAADEDYNQALGRFFPQLSFRHSISKTEERLIETTSVFSNTPEKQSHSRRLTSLEVRQMIIDMSKVRDKDVASARQQQSHDTYDQEFQLLMAEVLRRYMGVLSAKENLQFVSEEYELYGRRSLEMEKRQQRGLANGVEVAETIARLAEVSARVLAAESELSAGRASFTEFTGIAEVTLMPMAENAAIGSLVDADEQALLKQLLEKNSRLIAARSSVHVAEKRIASVKAGHIPTVELIGSWQRDELYDVSNPSSRDADITEDVKISLQLQVPLFEGGSRTAATRAAHYRALAEQDRATALERELLTGFTTVFTRMNHSLGQYKSLRKAQKNYRLALDAKRKGYDAGRYSNLELLDAARDYYAALREQSRQKYEYVLAAVETGYLVGEMTNGLLRDYNQKLLEN